MKKMILHVLSIGDYTDGFSVTKDISIALPKYTHKKIFCNGLMTQCFIQKYKNAKDHNLTLSNTSSRCHSCKLGVEKDQILLNEFYDPSIRISYEYESYINSLVEATLYRYYAVSDLSNQQNVNDHRRLLYDSAKKFLFAFDYFLKKNKSKIHCIFAHHGIYVPQGISNYVCKMNNVPFYSWWRSYRENTVLFSRNGSYHEELPLLDPKKLSSISETLLSQAADYLKVRITSDSKDNQIFSFKSGLLSKIFLNYIKFKYRKKILISVFTNVGWDAKSHYSPPAFESQEEWLKFLNDWSKNKKNIKLIIRVHPAEKKGLVRSRDSVVKILKDMGLSNNIFLIDSKTPISSYKLALISDLCLTYNTKFTIEAAAMGIQTLSAGDAWGKKVKAFDSADTKKTYIRKLESLITQKNSIELNYQAIKLFAYIFLVRMVRILNINTHKNYKINKEFAKKIDCLEDIEIVE